MTETRTAAQLLIVALQDLYDAERAWGEAGPSLQASAGPDVARFLRGDVARADGQAGRLEKLLSGLSADTSGSRNIWLRAVLQDAERDVATTAAGRWRDVALVGAFRKGKQAERVSYETAIALADHLGRGGDGDALRLCRDEEAEADGELAELLMRLTSP